VDYFEDFVILQLQNFLAYWLLFRVNFHLVLLLFFILIFVQMIWLDLKFIY